MLDIERAGIATFSGMLRASPLGMPPTKVVTETYREPMTDWLEGFALEDGYKPFNPDFASAMAERLRSEGVEKIPEDPAAARGPFGVGGWEHDPEQATKLMEAARFSNEGGTWMTPEGEPWQIAILASADFEVQSRRLAFAVANEWRQFGGPTKVQQMQAGAFFTAENAGNYDVGSYWRSSRAIIPDLFVRMTEWHEGYARPVGTPASANESRHTDKEIGDPRIEPLGTNILKALVQGQPVIEMFGTSKFASVNETYWSNYPTAENSYEGSWRWSSFKLIAARLEPASAEWKPGNRRDTWIFRAANLLRMRLCGERLARLARQRDIG